MQSNIAMNQQVSPTVSPVEADVFSGEGCELFGCYAEARGNIYTGYGSELYGCYNQKRGGDTLQGQGSELFGCYQS